MVRQPEVQEIIDPGDTRRCLPMRIEAAHPILKRRAGPNLQCGVRP